MTSKCPICASSKSKKISENLLLCTRCGIIYNASHSPAVYSTDYFGQEYKAQYGKTYEDDFESIYAASLFRLSIIKKYLKNNLSAKSLLDIGCALGFFCKAARDVGFGEVEGLEISEYAASFGRQKYNIPVYVTGFEDFIPKKKYDVITAWFVLEHCSDPYAMFVKIYEMLQDYGILACTLPSYFGPLFYCHRREWVMSHPQDHRIDVAPWSIKKLFQQIGFSCVRCFPSGYHPERFGTIAQKYKKLYNNVARLLCFSDTILVIASKKPQ
ncbi:MAG: class I SAM-dependent methyltransferase [Spirochaetota bacterium]